MKILTVVGARPQFIKAAAVSKALCARAGVREVLVHTGQHFDLDMSGIFFKEMGIPEVDYNLGISGGGHGEMTGRMLSSIERVIESEQPDYVLVYGDTNSTLAAALAAVKIHVPVAHVEAGLRSHNMAMPEEINRVLTDRVSQFLFCPTKTAVSNLEAEGFDRGDSRIQYVGDVMQDVALSFRNKAQRPNGLEGIRGEPFTVATIHRAENTNSPKRLTNIVTGLNRLSDRHPVIFPIHPRTRAAIDNLGLKLRVTAIDPVGYLGMIWLLEHCQCVVTDSGGLQKEAYFYSKPCVTVRNETEWIELIDIGANCLSEADPDIMLDAVMCMKDKIIENMPELYGGGKASECIAQILVNT